MVVGALATRGAGRCRLATLPTKASMVSNVDARTDVTVPERAVGVTVQAPAAAEPALTRKRIETDDKGRITGVIEERA
jgi:hypothetical protein